MEVKHYWGAWKSVCGDVLWIIEEMLNCCNTLKLAIYGCSRYNIIQWMIYASIFRPFSSNFLPAYHYVYALDYHAVFPQFCVSLPHYSHYGVTLRMDMRRFHSAHSGQRVHKLKFCLFTSLSDVPRCFNDPDQGLSVTSSLLLARGQCHE